MNDISQTVANLDAWLETMRCPDGYGGPVVHWWQNCLSYAGAGLDWRYEGIISGYLTLWRRTGERQWLEKARRAGDDLVKGQLPSGNYRHSCFEQNPYAGGTPHEAAADLGLFNLALALRSEGIDRWERFAKTAECNLRGYFLDRLWDQEARVFRDSPDVPSLVPNKACTLVEALFACSELRQNDELIEHFALPTLCSALAIQMTAKGPLQGAIAQNQLRGVVVETYFPYYIARCVPALLNAYEYTNNMEWLDAAMQAGNFIHKHIDDHGRLPQVVYSKGINRYPQWIAPLGDTLRVFDLLIAYGIDFRKSEMESNLIQGQLPSGGFSTATGFASQIRQKNVDGRLPDFRDNIPVAGWCDKAFAYLAALVPEGQTLPPAHISDVSLECQVRGRSANWYETATEMKLISVDKTYYHWHKGEPWASFVAPEVMWK